MKQQYINTIRSGDKVDDVFVLSEKSLSQKKDGDLFLNLVLADKTGKIRAFVWDKAERIAQLHKTGNIVRVIASASEYNGKLRLVVQTITACEPETVDPMDFIPTTSRNIDEMFERLVKLTQVIQNRHLRKLIDLFWNDADFVKQFKTAPAAKHMHHAYLGGLLEHTLSMAILAHRISGHYSGVNTDLLLTGIIFHDMGKTKEFDYRFKIEYSNEGRLLNHIVIGYRMLEEKLRLIDDFPEELAQLLKHMVISHHGIREFGSPEPPKTIEAVILNYIDEIDAKINGIREFIAADESDEPWTSYHKLMGRQFFKGNGNPI